MGTTFQISVQKYEKGNSMITKKKIKGHITVLAGALISAILLTGCVSEEEKQQAAEWRAQAEENAVIYIEDKYGFEAEVIDSETQKVSGLLSATYISQTLVKMEYDGKEFSVIIDGEGEFMDDAADNYQKDEIRDAFAKRVCQFLQVQPDRLRMSMGDNKDAQWNNSDEFYDHMFHVYYDGDNLEDVIMEYPVVCIAEIVGDTDLDEAYEENEDSLFENDHLCMLAVTYDSENDMKKTSTKDLEYMEDDDMEDYVYENAMYVKDALLLKYNGEAVPFDISIGQCEDFYYMSVGVDTSEYEIVADEDTIDADMWNGRGSLDATSVDDTAYYIEGNCGYQLYIYYPKDKFPKLPDAYDDIPIRIATCNDNKDGERSYSYAFSADSLGKNEPEDYEVFWLYHADAEDASFRFQYDRGD